MTQGTPLEIPLLSTGTQQTPLLSQASVPLILLCPLTLPPRPGTLPLTQLPRERTMLDLLHPRILAAGTLTTTLGSRVLTTMRPRCLPQPLRGGPLNLKLTPNPLFRIP